MEYLLVTGFAFLLLIPIIIIGYSESARFGEEVTAAQIQKVGATIGEAVNTVYYAGPPTKKTIKVHFPEKVQNVAINESSIVFTVQGSGGAYEYAVYTETNLTGAIRPYAGVHVLTVTAGNLWVNVTET